MDMALDEIHTVAKKSIQPGLKDNYFKRAAPAKGKPTGKKWSGKSMSKGR